MTLAVSSNDAAMKGNENYKSQKAFSHNNTIYASFLPLFLQTTNDQQSNRIGSDPIDRSQECNIFHSNFHLYAWMKIGMAYVCDRFHGRRHRHRRIIFSASFHSHCHVPSLLYQFSSLFFFVFFFFNFPFDIWHYLVWSDDIFICVPNIVRNIGVQLTLYWVYIR